jgi:glycerol-3-phosphate acyltransferase PlsX
VSDRVRIALDANGADRGPREVAQAAAMAAASGIEVLLFGPELRGGPVPAGVEVVDAPGTGMSAASAGRCTPRARLMWKRPAASAAPVEPPETSASARPSATACTACTIEASGVARTARAGSWALATETGAPFLLLDAGANVEVRPEHLVQFAHMGAAFMEEVVGVARPRVALLSNGEEPSKGHEDIVAAHAALATGGGVNFVGNVEGFAVGTGAADVIVADGFTGNVALKVMEGASSAMLGFVRAAARSSARAKLGGLLLRPALRGLRDELDPEAQGGAVLLGLRRLVVVPHGSFGARGLARATEVAARGVREDLVERTHDRLAAAGALRGSAVASEPVVSVPHPS